MTESSPYHEGELLVQERAGETEIGRRNGVVISGTIIKGALRFVAKQPLALVGSTDEDDRLWASALIGRPGFMSAEDRSIEFDLTQAAPIAADPLWRNIDRHPEVGTLIIDLASRRRLRVNGRIERAGDDLLRLGVIEAYPNCPKYIQRRTASFAFEATAPPAPPAPREGTSLAADHAEIIGAADTMFVASAHPDRGVDMSHRGGKPGFVRVLDGRTLRIPDYAGNSMFNTLGNFVSNPRAGLLFIDFASGRILQLTGTPAILWDLDVEDHETGGTRRYWEFAIEQWIETSLPVAVTWEFLDASPFNV